VVELVDTTLHGIVKDYIIFTTRCCYKGHLNMIPVKSVLQFSEGSGGRYRLLSYIIFILFLHVVSEIQNKS